MVKRRRTQTKFIVKRINYVTVWRNLQAKRRRKISSDLPKTGARMYDPVTCCLLPDTFLHKSFFAPKKFHGKFVVSRLEQGLQLILKEALLDLLARETRARFLLRGPIKRLIVHSEMDLTAAFVIHLVAWNTNINPVKNRSALQDRNQLPFIQPNSTNNTKQKKPNYFAPSRILPQSVFPLYRHGNYPVTRARSTHRKAIVYYPNDSSPCPTTNTQNQQNNYIRIQFLKKSKNKKT